MMNSTKKSWSWPWQCFQFGDDEAESKGLRLSHDIPCDSAVTEMSRWVFHSGAVKSLICSSRRWVKESSIQPWIPLWFCYSEVKVESFRFRHECPSDSIMSMPSRKVFYSFTVISSIKLKERAVDPLWWVGQDGSSWWWRGDTLCSSTLFSQVKGEGNPLPPPRLTERKERGSSPPFTWTNRVEGEGKPPPSTRIERVEGEGNPPSLYSV